MTTSIVALFAVAQTAGNLALPPDSNDEIAFLATDNVQPLAIAESPRLSVNRSRDGLFHITALIGDQPVDMAVDTGATRTVLAQSDAQRIGLMGRSGDYSNMQTLNGRVQLQRVVLHELKIGNRKMRNLDIAIGPQQLDQSIVGLDVLSQSGPILIEADRLTLLADEAQHP